MDLLEDHFVNFLNRRTLILLQCLNLKKINMNIKIILDNLFNYNIVNMDITEINLNLGNKRDKKKNHDKYFEFI